MVNPLNTGGLFHCFMLDESTCHYRDVGSILSPYGGNLIAPCSQVHDNFTLGVNRKILINLIYLLSQKHVLRVQTVSEYLSFTHYRYVFFKFLV